jgi:histidyl-tRNA synthetase
MPCLEVLRQAGVSVVLNAGGGSMKSQFKRADASGARVALIFGADELLRGEVALKALRDPAAPQTLRPISDAARWAHELRNA